MTSRRFDVTNKHFYLYQVLTILQRDVTQNTLHFLPGSSEPCQIVHWYLIHVVVFVVVGTKEYRTKKQSFHPPPCSIY